jgi:uncharacterized membrane protein (UPF0136 family)
MDAMIKKDRDMVPLAVFCAVMFTLVGGLIGYLQGAKNTAFKHGVEVGIQQSNTAHNELLKRDGCGK